METSPSSTLGPFLRSLREKSGLSNQFLAETTGIKQVILENLEKGDWSDLPPTPYVRAFLGTLARYYHLDKDEFLSKFDADSPSTVKTTHTEHSDHPTPQPPTTPYQPITKRTSTTKSPKNKINGWYLGIAALIILYITFRFTALDPHEQLEDPTDTIERMMSEGSAEDTNAYDSLLPVHGDMNDSLTDTLGAQLSDSGVSQDTAISPKTEPQKSIASSEPKKTDTLKIKKSPGVDKPIRAVKIDTMIHLPKKDVKKVDTLSKPTKSITAKKDTITIHKDSSSLVSKIKSIFKRDSASQKTTAKPTKDLATPFTIEFHPLIDSVWIKAYRPGGKDAGRVVYKRDVLWKVRHNDTVTVKIGQKNSVTVTVQGKTFTPNSNTFKVYKQQIWELP